ncbi:MAG TPA: hypothetical protein VMR21_13420 [Vicinamibacteria bacterium]|nr:hypothetical protein [Vicinamibacteria bacterium]
MPEVFETASGFLLILLLPFLIVAGGLVTLFAVGALFDALDHPEELRARVDAAFRRPPRAPRATGPEHYYRPYWAGKSE